MTSAQRRNGAPATERRATGTSWSLLAGVLLSLALVWSLAGALGEGSSGTAEPLQVRPHVAAAVSRESPSLLEPEIARQALPDAANVAAHVTELAPDPDAGPPRRVRVRGQVRARGAPAADRDLSFRSLDRPDLEDWDFTDDEGRYEVALPPGTYDVACEDAEQERWLARVIVPACSFDLTVDLQDTR